MQKMGYESVVVGKIDQRERKWRREKQELEVWWRGPAEWAGPNGSASPVSGKGIFTHILHENEFNSPCNLDSKVFNLKKDAD